MLTAAGTLGLFVATLAAALLLTVAASSRVDNDGGRALGSMMFGLGLAAGLLLAYGCAMAQGGLQALFGERLVPAARVALLAAALLSACVVVVLSAALAPEPREQVPWALWPVRAWAPWLMLPVLLAGAALALFPGLRQALPAWAWPAPLWALGGLSLALGLALLVQLGQEQASAQRARVQDELAFQARRDATILQKVRDADPVRDLVSLLPQTSPYEEQAIRELALTRLRQHPDLNAGLAAVLQGAWPREAFTYLAAHEPPDAAALAEPVREGIERYAAELQDAVSRTHTLRPDDFLPAVLEILAVAERYGRHGVDYRPALRRLRDAFDAPRDHAQKTPAMAGRRAIDDWLQRHGG